MWIILTFEIYKYFPVSNLRSERFGSVFAIVAVFYRDLEFFVASAGIEFVQRCAVKNISIRLWSKIKKEKPCDFSSWSHLGSNQGPPDYESGALTN